MEPWVSRRYGLFHGPLEAERGDRVATEAILCDTMGLRGRSGIRSLRSQGQGMSVCRQGFFGRYGDRHYLLQAQAHSDSLCPGLPGPPRCPKTGLEPLTLGEAARWSPEPRPLRVPRTLIGQQASPSLTTPPGRVVSVRSSSRMPLGDWGDERCLGLGAQDLYHSLSATVRGSLGCHVSLPGRPS